MTFINFWCQQKERTVLRPNSGQLQLIVQVAIDDNTWEFRDLKKSSFLQKTRLD